MMALIAVDYLGIESTVKYFLMQIVAGFLVLFGFMYSLSSLILAGFMLKVGGAPFHFWVSQVFKASHW